MEWFWKIKNLSVYLSVCLGVFVNLFIWELKNWLFSWTYIFPTPQDCGNLLFSRGNRNKVRNRAKEDPFMMCEASTRCGTCRQEPNVRGRLSNFQMMTFRIKMCLLHIKPEHANVCVHKWGQKWVFCSLMKCAAAGSDRLNEQCVCQVWGRRSHLGVKCALLLLLSGPRFALLTEGPLALPKTFKQHLWFNSPRRLWPMHTTAHDRSPQTISQRHPSLVCIRTAQAAHQSIDLGGWERFKEAPNRP